MAVNAVLNTAFTAFILYTKSISFPFPKGILYGSSVFLPRYIHDRILQSHLQTIAFTLFKIIENIFYMIVVHDLM